MALISSASAALAQTSTSASTSVSTSAKSIPATPLKALETLVAEQKAAQMSSQEAPAEKPGPADGINIGPWLNPGEPSLKGACMRGEADSRLQLDRSNNGILSIKGGESPISWHGGSANAYRYCRQMGLELKPMPTTKTLIDGVTQQLTVGTSAANHEASSQWKVALAYGSVRLEPVTRADIWDETSTRGYVAFHFDVRAVNELLNNARKSKQNAYMLILRGNYVQRILFHK